MLESTFDVKEYVAQDESNKQTDSQDVSDEGIIAYGKHNKKRREKEQLLIEGNKGLFVLIVVVIIALANLLLFFLFVLSHLGHLFTSLTLTCFIPFLFVRLNLFVIVKTVYLDVFLLNALLLCCIFAVCLALLAILFLLDLLLYLVKLRIFNLFKHSIDRHAEVAQKYQKEDYLDYERASVELPRELD